MNLSLFRTIANRLFSHRVLEASRAERHRYLALARLCTLRHHVHFATFRRQQNLQSIAAHCVCREMLGAKDKGENGLAYRTLRARGFCWFRCVSRLLWLEIVCALSYWACANGRRKYRVSIYTELQHDWERSLLRYS